MMQPPPLPSQVAILQRVLDRVTVNSVDGGPVPLVVFGIDGTLYDNRPRTVQILHEYAQVCDDDVADALLDASPADVRFMLSQTLRKRGVHQAELVAEITSFWRERFFSELYLDADELRPGAPNYLRRLYDAGAGIVYLSGRDIPGMLMGTMTRLRDDDFPLAAARLQLVLKPDATLGDESFKRRALKEAARLGEVIAAFDSNPNTCEMAHGFFPGADIGLVDAWGLHADDQAVELVRDFRM